MAEAPDKKVLWGLNPTEVRQRIKVLTADRDRAIERATTAESRYNELRLQSAQQVEEASAEAAVVLGHARSEATRIREAAVEESDQLRRDTERATRQMVEQAEAAATERLGEAEAAEEKAEKAVAAAQKRADEIIRFANSQAEKLRSEAYEILRSAEGRSQSTDNEIRLKRLDAERAETELIDKANQYSKRVHQEADLHWQTTQKRSEELRVQAEDLLRQTQSRAQEISKDATNSARRLLEETLEQLTRINSEVGASMGVVSRVRQSVGDQLERLEIVEARSVAQETISIEPMTVALESPSPEESSSDEPLDFSDDDGDDGPANAWTEGDDSDVEDATENRDEALEDSPRETNPTG